jgi:hypothetical protein
LGVKFKPSRGKNNFVVTFHNKIIFTARRFKLHAQSPTSYLEIS